MPFETIVTGCFGNCTANFDYEIVERTASLPFKTIATDCVGNCTENSFCEVGEHQSLHRGGRSPSSSSMTVTAICFSEINERKSLRHWTRSPRTFSTTGIVVVTPINGEFVLENDLDLPRPARLRRPLCPRARSRTRSTSPRTDPSHVYGVGDRRSVLDRPHQDPLGSPTSNDILDMDDAVIFDNEFEAASRSPGRSRVSSASDPVGHRHRERVLVTVEGREVHPDLRDRAEDGDTLIVRRSRSLQAASRRVRTFRSEAALQDMTQPSAAPAPYALVVDDDAFIRLSAIDILEEAGFRTFEAHDGDAAMVLLGEHQSSIVLLFTDVQMPGSRDGFAVARETASQWPHIAIVVASGQAKPGPGDMPEGARFIGKPFSGEMITAHIKEILPDGQKPAPLRQ